MLVYIDEHKSGNNKKPADFQLFVGILDMWHVMSKYVLEWILRDEPEIHGEVNEAYTTNKQQ